MPTKNKNAGYRASEEFIKALDELIHPQQRSDFIHAAVLEKLQREFPDAAMPEGKRPAGYQMYTLPPGWKSRLYQDRYQLVARWNEREQQFIFQHLHLLEELPGSADFTVRCDTPLVAEVYIYAPRGMDDDVIRQQAAMDLLEQVDGLLIEES